LRGRVSPNFQRPLGSSGETMHRIPKNFGGARTCSRSSVTVPRLVRLGFHPPPGRRQGGQRCGVSCYTEEGTESRLLRAKFHPYRYNDKGVGPQKLKFLLRFDQNVEYTRPHRDVSLARFSQNLQNLYHISGRVRC